MLSVSGKHIMRDKSPQRLSLNVGDGVAKEFQEEIFFGTITAKLTKPKWWHVQYEDGDEEDLDIQEARDARKLYLYYRVIK